MEIGMSASAMRLVETGTDERSRIRKRLLDRSPQVSHLTGEGGGRTSGCASRVPRKLVGIIATKSPEAH
jgi:hypothetical protein